MYETTSVMVKMNVKIITGFLIDRLRFKYSMTAIIRLNIITKFKMFPILLKENSLSINPWLVYFI